MKSASCKLAWVMRFIRAAEQGNWRRTMEARAAFPEIESKVGKNNDKLLRGKNLDVQVHSWIIELARNTVSEEMEEVKRMQAEGDDCGVKRGKENIIRRLKRINGSTDGGIKAMKNDKGEIKTDAKGMIEILQAHWAKVFGKKEVDNQMLIRWLNEMYPRAWTIRRSENEMPTVVLDGGAGYRPMTVENGRSSARTWPEQSNKAKTPHLDQTDSHTKCGENWGILV